MKWFQWLKNWRKKNVSIKQEESASNAESPPLGVTDNSIGDDGISVRQLKQIVIKNYPPFTWEKLGLYLYNDFQRAGMPFTHLKDDDILSLDLVLKINSTLKLLYNKRLPVKIQKKQLS